jgi:hypothetical protein
MKNCKTLSRNWIRSAIRVVSFHSSYFSKLTDDKQQTALRSSFVAR